MKYKKLPPKDLLHKRLYYNAQTGLLTWKKDHGKKMKKGSVVGYSRKDGYVYVYVDGVPYMAHRLIMVMSGYCLRENQQIDHINNKRGDNRLCNLRIVDQETNQSNRKVAKNNKTGTTGVYQLSNGKYAAQIKKYGKTIHLGSFTTLQEAVKARKVNEKTNKTARKGSRVLLTALPRDSQQRYCLADKDMANLPPATVIRVGARKRSSRT